MKRGVVVPPSSWRRLQDPWALPVQSNRIERIEMTYPLVIAATSRRGAGYTVEFCLYGRAILTARDTRAVLLDADRRRNPGAQPPNGVERRHTAPVSDVWHDAPLPASMPSADGAAVCALIGQQVSAARVDPQGILEVSCLSGLTLCTRDSRSPRRWRLLTAGFEFVAPSGGGVFVRER